MGLLVSIDTRRLMERVFSVTRTKKLTREKKSFLKFFCILKNVLHSMAQNIKNQCIFLYKFDIKFACLNLYGIIFHEQQVCVCVFKHMWWRPILTCPLRHKWLKMQNHTQTTAGHGMSHSLFDTIFFEQSILSWHIHKHKLFFNL